jgi:methionyl-tRNA synthetase
MIQRYCDGRVPDPATEANEDADIGFQARITTAIARTIDAATRYDFSQGLRETWELISAVNKYIVGREPWVLAKAPESRPLLNATLYNAADALRVVAALVDPVMPGTAGRIRVMLGTASESWVGLRAGTLTPGLTLGRIDPLFPRMEHSVDELRAMATSDGGSGEPAGPPAPATSQTAPATTAPAAAPAQPAAPAAAASDRISIDDFMKVDLRVAKVLTAEKVANSRKLVKMTIDVGTEQRTLVAGIAEAYEPEQLVGRTIVMVFNLKPAKLMGIESNGMVLAASPDGGKPTLIGFDQEVPAGTRVR